MPCGHSSLREDRLPSRKAPAGWTFSLRVAPRFPRVRMGDSGGVAESPHKNKHADSVHCRRYLAEREGFEPSVQLPVHMISNHAPSTTRSPLLVVTKF